MTSPPPPDMLLHQEDTSALSGSPLTAGQWLKQARQAKGVHLAVLAVTLKVPVRQLEALEADQYDAFKGGPSFLRAVTSSMCRHLGVDAAPVLALLPSAVSSMSAPKPSLEAAAGLPRVSLRPARALSRHAIGVVLLAALMLLVIAAFLWLPSPENWWPAQPAAEPASASAEDAAVPLGQASNPESTEEPSAAVSAASAPAALPDASAPASAPVKPQAAVATPAPVAAPAVLRLEASADTWVDVRDAKGPVIGKLLKSGDALDISPQPPYSVSIGRAAAVKATLRGQPFDLKPHTSVSVARFEVKE
jgi:cytoskeleton protein RodZ